MDRIIQNPDASLELITKALRVIDTMTGLFDSGLSGSEIAVALAVAATSLRELRIPLASLRLTADMLATAKDTWQQEAVDAYRESLRAEAEAPRLHAV